MNYGRQERRTSRGLTLGLCALIPTLVAACEREMEHAPQPQLRPVKYLEVFARGAERKRSFTGLSKADVRSDISFRVAGTIERVHVQEGDVLQLGDPIAEVDPTDFEIQIRETEASLADARAQAALTRSEFQRIQRLFERNNVSQGDFESALARRESAEAHVDAVEQQLEKVRRQLSYTTLTAPMGGGVVEVVVAEGEAIQAGDPVVNLLSGGNPQVEIAMPENLIAEVRRGAPAQVSFVAVPGQVFPGQVTTVGIVPSEGLTTYPITITLNQTWLELAEYDSPVRPGMAVEAQLSFGSTDSRPRYIVPAAAVLEDRSGRFVYVVKPHGEGQGLIERREVESGQLEEDGLQVFSGLDDGEKVVIAGLNQIQDGQLVRLLR